MGKRLGYFLFIVFYAINLFAQEFDLAKVDSLKQQLLVDTAAYDIADIHYDLADIYYTHNLDSSLYYTQKYLEASMLTKDSFWVADAYNCLGYVYIDRGELDLAIENYKRALAYFEDLKDSVLTTSCYLNIGYSISFGAKQANSLAYFLKGLKMAELIRDSVLMSDSYTNLAYFYDFIKDYKMANVYNERALELNLTQSDSVATALSYAFLAYSKNQLDENEGGENCIAEAKKYITETYTQYELADLYSSIVDYYIESTNVDSAQWYLHKLEDILSHKQLPILKAYANLYNGQLFLIRKKYQTSIKYFDKSIKLFKKVNAIEPFSLAYTYKAEAYAEQGDFRNAYDWQLKSKSIDDSLNFRAVAGALSKYEQDLIYETEQRKNQLEVDLEKQLNENYKLKMRTRLRSTIVIIVFLLVFVVIASLFYFAIRKKNKDLFLQKERINEQNKLLEQNVLTLKSGEKKLKDINATKDKFFSIIAHDLRNPMQSIIGLSNLFIKDQELLKTKDMLPILSSLNKSANIGYSLLENLLEWARSQTGTLVSVPSDLEIAEIFYKCSKDFKLHLEEKNITLNNHIEGNPKVYADEHMVATVLRNLIHNAIKFTEDEGIISIRTIDEADKLIVCVQDSGVGISEENLPNVFAMHGKTKKLGTKKEKGSGLGLILCKEFIEKNNGEIWVESQLNEGSKFYFSLPKPMA